MKKKIRNTLRAIYLMPVLVLLLLLGALSIPAGETGADQSHAVIGKGPAGLTVQLNLPTYKSNVGFSLYKVGTIQGNSYTLSEPYSTASASASIVLNELSSSQKAQEAANRLLSVAKSSSLTPEGGGAMITDANGQIRYDGLEEGVYVLGWEKNIGSNSENVVVQTSLFSIPEKTDQPDVLNRTVNPKATENGQHVSCQLSVKKRYVLNDPAGPKELYTELDGHVYVRLYYDPEGTAPATEWKQLIVQKGSTSEPVTFTDLLPGTYYLIESYNLGTDNEQNLVMVKNLEKALNEHGNEFQCIVSEDNSGTASDMVELSITDYLADREKSFTIENSYIDFPDGFFLNGRINIKKNVYNPDQEITTVDDVFYASIFEPISEEGGQREYDYDFPPFATVALTQNDTVSVNVPIDETYGVAYYKVVETLEDGTPVDSEDSHFDYEYELKVITNATGEPGEVQLTTTGSYPSADVSIDNRITPTPPPTTTTTTEATTTTTTERTTTTTTQRRVIITPTTVPGSGNRTGSTGSSYVQQQSSTQPQSIRTSDDTPIAMYVIILAIAAAAIVILVVRKRKK